ncbi:MAG: hypothetical protein NTU62_13570 [Spirochaetes bacterium]|nr:hypothetical protein [Spirochaetota bacterium]
MKTACAVLILVVLALAPLCAQTTADNSGLPPQPYRTGFLTGWIIDLVGYALVVTGGAITFIAPDATMPLFGVGTLTMTIGGIVQNVYLRKFQAALNAAGAGVPDNAGKSSWTLTWISVGCISGAAVVGITQLAGDDASPWVSFGLMAGALICETVNMYTARTKWAGTLSKANQATPLSALDVNPEIGIGWNPETKTVDFRLALDITL